MCFDGSSGVEVCNLGVREFEGGECVLDVLVFRYLEVNDVVFGVISRDVFLECVFGYFLWFCWLY